MKAGRFQCYSIENLYTTLSVFKSILTDEFKLDEDNDKDDFNTCVELFIGCQSSFHNAATELNAWIACQRDLSRSGEASRLNLNSEENNIMDRFFRVKLDKVDKTYSVADIREIFPHASILSEDILQDKIQEFRNIDKQKHYRGKYELIFFKCFLRRVVNELNSRNSVYFSKKRKIHFQISDSNILSQLSQHAETPCCFIDYVRRIWQSNLASVVV